MTNYSVERYKFVRGACVLALLAMLTGCGGIDGVEFNSKLLDFTGLTSKSNGGEPVMAARAPLIAPPSNQLPQPQYGQSNATAVPAAQADANWPVDPETKLASVEDAKKARIAEYCKNEKWYKYSAPEEYNRITQDSSLCSTLFGGGLTDQLGGNQTKPGGQTQ